MNSQGGGLQVTETLVGTSAPAEDRELVAQAKAGSPGAFGELYERHHMNVYRSAVRILRNRQDAEDTVQRSFQRAFTGLGRFRQDSTFSTWVTRIAINEALMLLRKRRKPSSLSQTHSDGEAWPDVSGERLTPEQALAKEELRSLVHQAVSRLRESLRSVVLLRELQGLTSAETARRLGLTVSAVKARTFHAKRHLRRHLQHKYKVDWRDAL